MKIVSLLSSFFVLSSCSLLGIQNEESPNYKVLIQDGHFEIREYAPYIVAQTTVKGNYKKSSNQAFRILANYIFGKNKSKQKISMTSPVEVQESSEKIKMTSPVEILEDKNQITMSFSMPSKYQLADLPEPLDKRIRFITVPAQKRAVHRFSWFSSTEKNQKKADELREWLKKHPEYLPAKAYVFAGYNPPWTIPFLRRNEILINVDK